MQTPEQPQHFTSKDLALPPTIANLPALVAPNQFQGAILGGLNRRAKHVYAGTVPEETVARRRAANKRARAQRRTNRKRA